MSDQEKLRQEFESWWADQTERLKKNTDAILRERMEAWCPERNLTADIDLEIDWDITMNVARLEPAAPKREEA